MLEPEATRWEGFLPEENGGLGWEGERGSPCQESEETVPPGGALLTDASGNLTSLCPQESGDDEYQGDQSDTEDEVDSDFDIDEGDEPSSDGEAEEPRRKRRVVTKAYKVRGRKSWFSWVSFIPVLPSIRSQDSPHQSRFLQCWFSLTVLTFFLLISLCPGV